MEKSLEDLPVPEIKSSLLKYNIKENKDKEKKFTYLDKLLKKRFLDEYFKKKSK